MVEQLYNMMTTLLGHIDPTEYLDFIKNSIAKFQFKNIQFKKCWWLTYPENASRGLHNS